MVHGERLIPIGMGGEKECNKDNSCNLIRWIVAVCDYYRNEENNVAYE